MPGSLSIVGIGLEIPDDLTVATLRELEAAEVVMALPAKPLLKIVPEKHLIDLSDLYFATENRRHAYQAMAMSILEAAETRRVCFATYGNPIVGTDATQFLLRHASARHIQVKIFNAPSSFEAVCSRIGLDPFTGIQLAEASIFLNRPNHWSPFSWLFLQQVPYLGSLRAVHNLNGPRYNRNALEKLKSILLDKYGRKHRAAYVRVRVQEWPESIQVFELDQIIQATPANASTLVIPPKAIQTQNLDRG